jgi:nitrogen fixation protein FixH
MSSSHANALPNASASRRSPWPYGITAGLAVVVGVNLWVVRLAAKDPPLVEADKPYEVGEAYEQEIAAFRASASLGWRSEVDARPGRVRVVLKDAGGQPVGGLKGALVATRPDRKDRDQTLSFAEPEPGVYEANGDLSPAGIWRLRTSLGDARGTWLDDRRSWISP